MYKSPMKVNALGVKKLFEELNDPKKGNPGSIFMGGETKIHLAYDRVPTGLSDLDMIMGGGLPMKRIIQFYGKESSGKTSLASFFLSLFEISAFIDAEGTLVEERLDVFGADIKRVIIQRPETLQETFTAIEGLVEDNVPFIVVDSVPALTPWQIAAEKDTEKNTQPGLRAAFLSNRLPHLGYLCNQHNSTVLFINQIRDDFRAMGHGDTETMPGGHALKHQSSLIVKTMRVEWLSASGEKLGQTVKARAVKSKVGQPQGEALFTLIFDEGFSINTKEQLTDKLKEARKRSLKRQKEQGYIPVMIDPEDPTPVMSLEQLEKSA